MGVEGGAVADGSESKGTGAGVCINIRCSNGSKFSVQAMLDSDVRSFKCVLAQHCDIPADQQRLIYKGRILKDDETLESNGLEAEHTVHLVRGFVQSASPNSGIPSSTPNTRQVGLEESGAFGGPDYEASLFPGFDLNGIGGGTGGLFGSELFDFENMQLQLIQNPNLMRDIMNIPAMQNFMNNPDIIRILINSNPQMREVIDRNPEFAHILNDSSILRQTMETIRNPELLREMLRNTDRAMSNIESSPEGFNMLRRMYENFHEPFFNAATVAGNTRNDISSNSSASLLATPGEGQGNVMDQTTDPTSAGSGIAANSPAPNADPLPNPWVSGAAGGAQANSTGRPNSGLGLRSLDQMFDTSSLNQFIQNPAVSEAIQSIISNPQYLNQMLRLAPRMRNLVDSNPQLREMIQNPDLIRQLTSPEMMQQLLNFHPALPLLRAQSTTGDASQTGGVGLDMLMNMVSGLGIDSLGTIPSNRPNVALEELYATQLSQLQEMGFFDVQENLRALTATSGNIHAAVDRLLGNTGQ